MAKILVTGVAGYIGSVTADLLLNNGYEVIGLDNFSKGFKGAVRKLSQKNPVFE